MNGLLISFEGIKCSGKSTQISLLAKRLRAIGRRVLLVSEPLGTSIGKEIFSTLMRRIGDQIVISEAELLLIAASRIQLLSEVIRPALCEDSIVLCDRFYDSTMAYQGHGCGLNLEAVKAINDFAAGPIRPIVTFFMDISIEVSEERLGSQGTLDPSSVYDRTPPKDRPFMKRVMRGYRLIAANEPTRILTIDGSLDVETVHDLVWNFTNPLLASLR